MRTRHLRVEFDGEGALRTSRSQDPEDYERRKVRKVYGPKIREALLRALPEVRASRPGDAVDERAVAAISDRICNACYDEFSDCSRTFKRRIFELCANIKRESNHELRLKILTGQMTVAALVRADTLELAPEDLRERRRQEIERHYIRNVILKQDNGLEPPGDGPPAPAPTAGRDAPRAAPEPTIAELRQLFAMPPGDAAEPEPEAPQVVASHRQRIIADSDSDDDAPPRPSAAVAGPSGPVPEAPPPAQAPDTALPDPPRSADFTLEAVRARLVRRLASLPAGLAKPFTDPINAAVRRLEMLMQRSSVMAKRPKVAA